MEDVDGSMVSTVNATDSAYATFAFLAADRDEVKAAVATATDSVYAKFAFSVGCRKTRNLRFNGLNQFF